ncbi:MAG: hypothetical protein RLZZ157_732, partial [Pseudomonadota bacterium]
MSDRITQPNACPVQSYRLQLQIWAVDEAHAGKSHVFTHPSILIGPT